MKIHILNKAIQKPQIQDNRWWKHRSRQHKYLVLEALSKDSHITVEELALLLQVPLTSVIKKTHSLIASGLIRRTGDGGRQLVISESGYLVLKVIDKENA